MPIEIRELVIQANVGKKSEKPNTASEDNTSSKDDKAGRSKGKKEESVGAEINCALMEMKKSIMKEVKILIRECLERENKTF